VKLLEALRGAGIVCDADYTGRRMKAMLDQADAVNARYAVVFGDEELNNSAVNVRDMQSKTQETVTLDALAAFLGR